MAALPASVFTVTLSLSPSPRDRPDDDDQQSSRDGDPAESPCLRAVAERDIRRRQRDQRDRDQHDDEDGPWRGPRRGGGFEFRFGGRRPASVTDEGLVGDF